MRTVEYRRRKNIITHYDGTSKTYPSISKAKKASRQLQQKHGKLGDGFLRVKKPKPSYEDWANGLHLRLVKGDKITNLRRL